MEWVQLHSDGQKGYHCKHFVDEFLNEVRLFAGSSHNFSDEYINFLMFFYILSDEGDKFDLKHLFFLVIITFEDSKIGFRTFHNKFL